jgi:hypothetical protein
MSVQPDIVQRDLAWGRNAVAFIRERGLETEFNDWCGGWPCPVERAGERSPSFPELVAALEAIKHSIGQARIPGNDWKRELALIENLALSALEVGGGNRG